MGQAQGIQFRVANLDQQFRSMFPASFDQALTNDQHVIDERTRLDTSMAAYKQTMAVQDQAVENIAGDQGPLHNILHRSHGAHVSLQAQQEKNQLLAPVSKQMFTPQMLMHETYCPEAITRPKDSQDPTYTTQ